MGEIGALVIDVGSEIVVAQPTPEAIVGSLIGKYQGQLQPVLESGKIDYDLLSDFLGLLKKSMEAIRIGGSAAYSAYCIASRHLEIGLKGSERTSGVSEDKRAQALRTSLDSQFATIHVRFQRSRTYEINRRRNLN